ncbi:hypothetical protein FA95DRAFT_1565566 [Auriscalpium vulgare]|uniref:Uncharacterized protein n=1 Tax=Auriscalpium vulgare TaxID=40419 RepID=A0ACB8RCD3_9AGAM|nr:hypothetical protein FA95DRAFT_1565566 [Auriscalpium vulgare]
MSAPPLPFDIHARTLQFIYILSQSHDVDYRTLSACALVCKDWTAPAQRLLFRRIMGPSDTVRADEWLNRAAPVLLHAFTSRPHLGTYVRSIAIHALPIWVEVLRRCPHIAWLRLIGDGPLLSWEFLHSLSALGVRPSVLVVPGLADRNVVHAALAALPSVRHLVKEAFEDGGAERLNPELPSAAQLLSITSGDTTIDFSKLCVQPTTMSATEILFEDLDLDSLYFGDIMASVGHGVARNLRALTTYTVPSDALLKELTALESLIMGGLPSKVIEFTLPRTLLHFGFHAYYSNRGYGVYKMAQSLKILTAALSEPPNLRVVSVTRCSHSPVRHALKGASAARGVDFVEYVDPAAYPQARYVDWLW